MEKTRSLGGGSPRIPGDTSREIQIHAKSILEMLSLALGTDLDAKQRRYIESAKSSAGLLLYLVREVSGGARDEADAEDHLFDAEEMAKRMAGDREVIVEALDAFIDTCGDSVGRVVSAIKGRNPDELKTAAHNLKGMAANVSAKALRAISTEIERAAEREELSQVERLTARLDTLKDRTLAEIRSYLGKGAKERA